MNVKSAVLRSRLRSPPSAESDGRLKTTAAIHRRGRHDQRLLLAEQGALRVVAPGLEALGAPAGFAPSWAGCDSVDGAICTVAMTGPRIVAVTPVPG